MSAHWCKKIPLLAMLGMGCAAHAQLSLSHSLFARGDEPVVGLSNASELGFTRLSGNTRTSNLSLKQQTAYRWQDQTILGRLNYAKATANEITNAMNWAAEARYERRLMSHWGAFVGQTLQGDIFAGYRQRYSTDVGLRHVLWSNDTTKGTAELGYEYQRENRNGGDRDSRQLIRLFGEASYVFLPTLAQSLLSAEALPNLKHPEDWLMNIEASLQSEITRLFSLKVSYLVKVANRPPTPTTQKVDTTLTTSLALKF